MRKLDEARRGCERMRDLVIRLRKGIEPRVGELQAQGISKGSQPLVLWRNAGSPRADASSGRRAPRATLEEFCRVFPDTFFVSDVLPISIPKAAERAGR